MVARTSPENTVRSKSNRSGGRPLAVAEDLAGHAPELAPTAELKPPGSVKFFYSVGQMVESGYLAVATFVFFYYTAVLGLSGSLVGLALAISMCLDAVCDP